MEVGIRELKQRLSEYLDRVAEGEVIRVTDRGRAKAQIAPIRDERAIERGAREGWLALGEDRPPEPIRRARARKRSLELLREDRDGR